MCHFGYLNQGGSTNNGTNFYNLGGDLIDSTRRERIMISHRAASGTVYLLNLGLIIVDLLSQILIKLIIKAKHCKKD